MGHLVIEQIVSTDAFAAGPDDNIDFFQSAGDFAETEPEQLEFLTGVDVVLLGANTYRMFAGYWPTADAEKERIAVPINTLAKHVISSTLEAAPWGSFPAATVERGDVVATVRRLKSQYPRKIVVWGSLQLTAALFRAGLVDVLRLRVVPVLIGAGRSVTPADLAPTRLELVKARSYPRGHVSLEYVVR